MADPSGITDSPSSFGKPTSVTEAPSGSVPPPSNDEPAEHKPYVADEDKRPEFTWLPVLIGALLGIVFGASSLYLVLKVGLTVSASIPVAVLSITLFRGFSKVFRIRAATILENNIVQTTGSAGESIAFGVGVTMPALMLLGFEMNIGRVMVVSVLGGLLGILMMIPLRRAFIVKQHGKLKYPEGTACAEVLKAGDKGGATALTVFIGFGIAFVYEFFRLGFKWFKEEPEQAIGKWWKGAVASIEVNPALLGVGYIIGPRISCVMAAGGVLSAFVLIPAIRLFGDGLSEPLYPASTVIKDMSEDDIWHAYVLYIGAGAVAAGGIISVFQALPLIFGSIKAGLSDLTASAGTVGGKRTDRDLPLWIVGVGGLALVGGIWSTTPLHEKFPWVPDLQMHFLGAILIVLFGFLFVTVSSRLTGEIGSSSNPISGMTVATLLLTCLIFVLLGWTKLEDRLTALSVAAVVCIAASNGGTTSQDLKTGYLVGATPKLQQWAILIGSLTSALVIGFILIQLNNAYTVYSKKSLPSPKVPIKLADLKDTKKAPDDDTVYHVWRAPEENEQTVPPGEYLVDDEGKIRYLVDPGINGRLTRRDDGSEVTRFKAPKATLMSLITDGILRNKLPWPLVLLGVSISIVLELCGVPSLAFAVGVYLPLSSSTPIMVGGVARYVADRWGKKTNRSADPALAEAESDTSSGSLLSTGYIAGGAIAGVLIAFLSFSDSIPKALGFMQYRKAPTAEWMYFQDACDAEALRELGYTKESLIFPEAIEKKQQAGEKLTPDEKNSIKPIEDRKETFDNLTGEIADLNSELKAEYITVPAKTTIKLPHEQTFEAPEKTTLGQVSMDKLNSASKATLLFSLNVGRLVEVKAGTKVKLPEEKKEFTAPIDMSLLEIAKATAPKNEPGDVKQADDEDRANELYELNKKELEPPSMLPAGTQLKLPQQTWPAIAMFGLLTLFLIVVGLGWLFRAPSPTNGAT